MLKSTAFFIALLFFVCTLQGCNKEKFIDPRQAYENYMGIAIPANISEFSGSANKLEPDFWTRALFTYRAEPDYFTRLQRGKQTVYNNLIDHPLRDVACNSSLFVSDFTYWTKQQITKKDKQCYIVTKSPTVHYLLYQPNTKRVQHFVAGIRE